MSQKILGMRDEVDREKRGAGSRDKVQHIERDDHPIRNEDDTRERARVTRDEERKIFTAFRKRM